MTAAVVLVLKDTSTMFLNHNEFKSPDFRDRSKAVQVKADVLRRVVHLTSTAETPCFGGCFNINRRSQVT